MHPLLDIYVIIQSLSLYPQYPFHVLFVVYVFAVTIFKEPPMVGGLYLFAVIAAKSVPPVPVKLWMIFLTYGCSILITQWKIALALVCLLHYYFKGPNGVRYPFLMMIPITCMFSFIDMDPSSSIFYGSFVLIGTSVILKYQ